MWMPLADAASARGSGIGVPPELTAGGGPRSHPFRSSSPRALVAPLMQLFAELDAQKALDLGNLGAKAHRPQVREDVSQRIAGEAGGVPLH